MSIILNEPPNSTKLTKLTKTTSSYEYFWKQLEIGQLYERHAIDKIGELYDGIISIETCNDNRYDFIIQPQNISFEVKYDKMAIKTGYFFIEYEGYGKPSGISTTRAKFYILTDGKYFFQISVERLKQLILNCQVKKTQDNLTSGFLLNRFVLIKNSTVI
jgi:hypothetical protein